MIEYECDDCGERVQAANADEFPDRFLEHVRGRHPDWPYPDHAVRQVGARALVMSKDAPTERVDTLGAVEIRSAAEAIDDWLRFFDSVACAGKPAWQGMCYCLEPHALDVSNQEAFAAIPWQERRETMAQMLTVGDAAGYLAYVDENPAGWINASMRGSYTLYRRPEQQEATDDEVIAIACLLIAPPYRRHGVPEMLVSHTITTAPTRGAKWVEAYPFNDAWSRPDFHGSRVMYESLGFELVKELPLYSVMRISTPPH